MEKDLSFYRKEALEVFNNNGKLHAVKLLMDKRQSTTEDWNMGLIDCKELLESWIEDKEYISDKVRIDGYDKLKEERDLLMKRLNDLVKFIEVNELANKDRDIYFIEAKELLNNLKK